MRKRPVGASQQGYRGSWFRPSPSTTTRQLSGWCISFSETPPIGTAAMHKGIDGPEASERCSYWGNLEKIQDPEEM